MSFGPFCSISLWCGLSASPRAFHPSLTLPQILSLRDLPHAVVLQHQAWVFLTILCSPFTVFLSAASPYCVPVEGAYSPSAILPCGPLSTQASSSSLLCFEFPQVPPFCLSLYTVCDLGPRLPFILENWGTQLLASFCVFCWFWCTRCSFLLITHLATLSMRRDLLFAANIGPKRICLCLPARRKMPSCVAVFLRTQPSQLSWKQNLAQALWTKRFWV